MPDDGLARPPERPRRFAFLGTPPAAVPPLRALVAAGHDVELVVTRADKRRGRRAEPSPSPVKAAAQELGLRVSHELDDVVAAGVDLGVVVAYGRIIPRRVLERVPMVNLHFSLLPRWRGAAPVERAILAGDAITGVCLMGVEEGLDTGPVYARTERPIPSDATASELLRSLSDDAAGLLVDALAAGLGEPVPQEGEPTYAEKLGSEDRFLDARLPAVQLDRIVRIGGAWTTVRDRRLKVLRARPVPSSGGAPGTLDGTVLATGDGGLELLEVQPEGRGPVEAGAWRNGARLEPGERLGT